MRLCRLSFVAACLLAVAVNGQTTQPAALELRATQAFNRGEYAIALPMLKKLEQQLKDDPGRVGAVQERIRVCERNLAAPPADPQAALGERPAAAVPSAESRKVHPAPKAGETVEIAIKELGNFDYDAEKGGNIPADVKRLSGTSVRLHGFMIPMDQSENITQFAALVPSLFACCYGQPPQVQHTVVVNSPRGKAVSYCPDELVIEGKLTVDEKKDDGYITSIFQVEVSSVKPAPK